LTISWTEPSLRHLENIFAYIAEDNSSAAGRTVVKIRETVRRVALMPYSGRAGRVAGTREISVPGTSYLAAYRVVDGTIQVLAILHGAQEWPRSFAAWNPRSE